MLQFVSCASTVFNYFTSARVRANYRPKPSQRHIQSRAFMQDVSMQPIMKTTPSRRGRGRKDYSAYSLKSVAFLRLTCLINGQPELFRLLYFMRGLFVTFCQDRHKREMIQRSPVDDTYAKHWRDIIGALYGQRLGRVFMHYALRSADWVQNIDGCSQRWREEHRNTIPPNPNPQNIRIKMIHLRKTPWQWIKK